ncbi:MAG: hypothetical protein UR96_C0013G0010 [candidate division WS6 bacterium GW2011_GWC1_36_11]|uniref:Uncharacterized protein n=2 Tax=Candidatus Dojkabacteria TaxID=74243 RepID=A0A0G0DTN2_9BACT|nr:MAG: hypothetical protein UR96_C0013G0010 [candidate division WS6 bacterium GW2011_GWC1_36_11]KKQ03037.1 MAG: hypothetical protein US14_C0039G0007 [candidate division WS6 bacterium GW2011_WS6_36_26]KKQ11377.1 MAG: hypothetical protein US24_C0030G0010 [candidate division WS6 bacterium GW2011_GWC2_36_7]
MAIERDKQGNIKWSLGDRLFNILMLLLLGWSDFLGKSQKGVGENG